jgi:hypothetical protein
MPAERIFICTPCQADAKQFLEIQDALWAPPEEAEAASREHP